MTKPTLGQSHSGCMYGEWPSGKHLPMQIGLIWLSSWCKEKYLRSETPEEQGDGQVFSLTKELVLTSTKNLLPLAARRMQDLLRAPRVRRGPNVGLRGARVEQRSGRLKDPWRSVPSELHKEKATGLKFETSIWGSFMFIINWKKIKGQATLWGAGQDEPFPTFPNHPPLKAAEIVESPKTLFRIWPWKLSCFPFGSIEMSSSGVPKKTRDIVNCDFLRKRIDKHRVNRVYLNIWTLRD